MKVGVLGAGVMGAGIAQVTATAGYETVCYDVDAGALERGLEHVTTGRYGFERGVERGKLTREDADAALARLSFTASFDDAADVDLVVEAVPEKLELKQQVFRDLDAAAPADTILASNTSGFPIGQLAAVTERPELVIGWHWASPPAVMRLAEIVRAEGTSDDDRADGRRRRDRVRQEPGGDHRHAERRVGLRRQPRVHGDDPGGESLRRRRHRHPRAGRHADGRLLPLAGRSLRHGAGRDLRVGSVAAYGSAAGGSPVGRAGRRKRRFTRSTAWSREREIVRSTASGSSFVRMTRPRAARKAAT